MTDAIWCLDARHFFFLYFIYELATLLYPRIKVVGAGKVNMQALKSL